MNKKLNNTTGLKIHYLYHTNTLTTRIKFTQTNNTQSVTIPYPDTNKSHEELCDWVLEQLPIESYQRLIDNTQSKYHTYILQFNETCIPNFIPIIKKILSS